ncbi:F5/8 type C domain-containing protein [Actinacidiphila yanglinensis]|uniref:F5/8 type C domain-containing protein n=1 Tax=Actinacidiphila yanglinensis TaxID=310779 RepID=A0A1H6B764_9ACTN|nr:discoidin domain-containing protein [Actinacidiphila yanglinensis]SEG56703.1 F5/8 type C domain-containing protein [Actinacidiphila yanglinensis]
MPILSSTAVGALVRALRRTGPAGAPRRRTLAVIAAVVMLVTLGGVAPALAAVPGKAAPAQQLTLGSDVDHVTVDPVPCAVQGFQLRFGNAGSSAVYADAFIDAPAPLTVSRSLVSSYLPSGYTLKVQIAVGAPRSTPPGTYTITVHAGDQQLSLPVQVEPAPVNDTGNLVRYMPVSASSENLPNYPACGAVDGDRDSTHWGTTTGWNDATKGTFPDWLQVSFDQPVPVGRVDLYTLDSAKYPAAGYGLSAWDVELQVGGSWQTVAQVRGNTAGEVSSTFAAQTATALRVVTLGSNEGVTYSRVVELEAYTS